MGYRNHLRVGWMRQVGRVDGFRFADPHMPDRLLNENLGTYVPAQARVGDLLNGRMVAGNWVTQWPCVVQGKPRLVDFCEERVRLAIEVDDARHRTADAIINDFDLDFSLAQRGYVLVRIDNEEAYGNRDAIQEYLSALYATRLPVPDKWPPAEVDSLERLLKRAAALDLSDLRRLTEASKVRMRGYIGHRDVKGFLNGLNNHLETRERVK